jgi:hypothetical protein
MKCKGCNSGCKVCQLENIDLCEICEPPLLLLWDKNTTKAGGTCVASCPTGFRASFDKTKCNPEGEIPVIWFPATILTILTGVICIGGTYSSKNVSGEHRVLLSFYSITGIADVLAIWMQVIFTVWQCKN